MAAPNRGEIRPLTGLRGAAAAFVVMYHYLAGQHYGGPISNILLHGYLSVDLFFVLSGFIMALNYQHLFAGGLSRAAYRKFLARRIARVYPLYLVATLCGFLIVYLRWIPFKFHGPLSVLVIENLFLVQTWGLNPSLDFPGWSISAEWAAYLLFPLLLLPATSRRFWVRALTAGLATLVLAALCAESAKLVWHSPVESLLNVSEPNYALPVIRCVAEFLLGLLAFRASESALGRTFVASSWPSSAISAVLLILLCFPRTDLAVALLIPPFILSLSGDRSPLARLLETPPLQFLGRISYSIYLVHGFFTTPVNNAAIYMDGHGLPHGQTVATGLGLLACLVIAIVAYHLIEVPGRHWVRRLFEGDRADRPAAVAADLRTEPGAF